MGSINSYIQYIVKNKDDNKARASSGTIFACQTNLNTKLA
jgi:hypothetical protein